MIYGFSIYKFERNVKMINFDSILNRLESEEVLLAIYNTSSKYNENDFKLFERDNNVFYWEILLKELQINYYNIINDLTKRTGKNSTFDVEALIGEFLFNNYKYLNINLIDAIRTNKVSQILVKHIYDKYALNQFDLFLDSMRFKKYDTQVLNLVWGVLKSDSDENKKQLFWNNCASFQNLSVSFIHMHYMKFNTPELAYKLLSHSSDFWKCNHIIIKKIKNLSLEFVGS